MGRDRFYVAASLWMSFCMDSRDLLILESLMEVKLLNQSGDAQNKRNPKGIKTKDYMGV